MLTFAYQSQFCVTQSYWTDRSKQRGFLRFFLQLLIRMNCVCNRWFKKWCYFKADATSCFLFPEVLLFSKFRCGSKPQIEQKSLSTLTSARATNQERVVRVQTTEFICLLLLENRCWLLAQNQFNCGRQCINIDAGQWRFSKFIYWQDIKFW